jgi:hypothetical protein
MQIARDELSFTCASGTISIPYTAIAQMQYRPDVDRKLRKQKIPWKVHPPWNRNPRNRFFTVRYHANGEQAAVFQVEPDVMLPFLAEIDLKTGKRVEVYESFEQ